MDKATAWPTKCYDVQPVAMCDEFSNPPLENSPDNRYELAQRERRVGLSRDVWCTALPFLSLPYAELVALAPIRFS